MAEKTIVLDSATVAKKTPSLGEHDILPVLSLAGVAKKFRVKHTAVGSGVFIKGDFAARSWADIEQPVMLESTSVLLPMEIGNKIAKHMKASKNPIKFKIEIGAKNSTMLLQGFAWSVEWDIEPQELGQLDIVREMLKA